MIKHFISHVIILLVGVRLRNKLQKTNYLCLEFLFCVQRQVAFIMLKDFISYGRLQDVVYMFALPFNPRRFYILKKSKTYCL